MPASADGRVRGRAHPPFPPLSGTIAHAAERVAAGSDRDVAVVERARALRVEDSDRLVVGVAPAPECSNCPEREAEL